MPSVATHSNVKSQCCALLAGRLYSFLDHYERGNNTLQFGLLLSTLRASAIKIETQKHVILDTPQSIKRAVSNRAQILPPKHPDDHVLVCFCVCSACVFRIKGATITVRLSLQPPCLKQGRHLGAPQTFCCLCTFRWSQSLLLN